MYVIQFDIYWRLFVIVACFRFPTLARHVLGPAQYATPTAPTLRSYYPSETPNWPRRGISKCSRVYIFVL